MKRMPWKAFFSVTTPATGERSVTVPHVARAASATTSSGEGPSCAAVPVPTRPTASCRRGFAARILHRLRALHGDGVLALGRDEFGAVDLEQRLALGHRLPGGIDVQRST